MKQLALAVLLPIVVAFAHIARAQQCPSTAPRPLLKPGDTWTYRNINDWRNTVKEKYALAVSSVSARSIQLRRQSLTSGAATHIVESTDLNEIDGISFTTGHADRWSPDTSIYNFPLNLGKTWEAKSKFEVKRADRTGSYTLDAKVVGCEKVTVPAGTFTAFKITEGGGYEAEANGYSGNGTMHMTVWYAPSVKSFVKEKFENTDWSRNPYTRVTIELLGYKVQ